MEKLQLSLLILQIIIAVMMVILVLLQKSDGDSLGGIGGGSGGMGAALSSKASASLLSKITMFLAAAFMINCLVLAAISGRGQGKTASEFEQVIENQEKTGSKSIKKPIAAPEVE
jgi:preprotein translocase subunit SecG